MSFLKSHSIQRALFKSCTWPLHNFSELNFAFLLCEFSSTCLGLTFGVPMLMFFTTKVDNKDPERRWKMYNCQVFLEIDKKCHFLWCHITSTISQLFRTRCVSEWPDTVNFQSHLEYRQDYIVIVVVGMVMLLVLMVIGHGGWLWSTSSWVQAGLHVDSGGMYGDGISTDGQGGWLWSRSSLVQAISHFCNCGMTM